MLRRAAISHSGDRAGLEVGDGLERRIGERRHVMIAVVPERAWAPRPIDRVSGWAEDLVYVGIAVLLFVGAVVLLVIAADQLLDVFDDFGSDVVVEVLDTLLLVFIVVELLSAVRTTMSERQLIAEPFLIVGIIASIKEIVVLSVKAAENTVAVNPSRTSCGRSVCLVWSYCCSGRQRGCSAGRSANRKREHNTHDHARRVVPQPRRQRQPGN